jgi:hypothetical protein
MGAKANVIFVTAIIVVGGLGLGVLQTSCSFPRKDRDGSIEKGPSNQNDSSQITTAEFCDVLKNPFRFESRVIRIKSRLSRFLDYMTFYDANCVPPHPLVSVEFSPSFQLDAQTETNKKLKEIIEGSEQARKGKVAVVVSAVGLFERIPHTADFVELQYRFTIATVEQVSESAMSGRLKRCGESDSCAAGRRLVAEICLRRGGAACEGAE